MTRRYVVTALAFIALGAAGTTPSFAAPKYKSFTKTVKFTDNTADPTGSATSGTDCSSSTDALPNGGIPKETPISVKVPAVGKLKVELTSTGDWALQVSDTKNYVIGSSDGSSPEQQEATTVKTKKAGTYKILPCNLGGLPDATVKYTWTPA